MIYSSLSECVIDLEKNGHLVRVKEEVDPNLEMAEIHRRIFDKKGPAIFFEKVKGTPFPAVSNLFGTMDRARFIFRSTLNNVKKIMELKGDPSRFMKNPFRYAPVPFAMISALPRKMNEGAALYSKCSISDLPQIRCWPKDGGSFVLLPQVYSEDPYKRNIFNSNMGMYRIQLSGNEYAPDKEIGLHYQIRRDIGIHHTKAVEKGEKLRVSIFVGGPPSHTLSAVMPLPEGVPEAVFAGVLAGRRFRYARKDGHVISLDADFCITGTIDPERTKPEGPFGDHLGYYSLVHEFPYLKVDSVYHRKDAIWPFTVVGRPPQEDSVFGELIHEITDPVTPSAIPGVRALHAVDASGVHPLLLAIGSERYVPYQSRKPMELLTIANAILGFGHCSLAKYLFIVAGEDAPRLDIHNVQAFFMHMLERMNPETDFHFQTATTIDTLDYSGEGLNKGSKMIIASAGAPRTRLAGEIKGDLKLPEGFSDPRTVMPGVMAVNGPRFIDAVQGENDAKELGEFLGNAGFPEGFPLLIICDDSTFVSKNMNNFLWTVFTRSNPSHDVYGAGEFIRHKHWGCRGPLIIDARLKPHHAPPLIEDPDVSASVDMLFKKTGSLYGKI